MLPPAAPAVQLLRLLLQLVAAVQPARAALPRPVLQLRVPLLALLPLPSPLRATGWGTEAFRAPTQASADVRWGYPRMAAEEGFLCREDSRLQNVRLCLEAAAAAAGTAVAPVPGGCCCCCWRCYAECAMREISSQQQ